MSRAAYRDENLLVVEGDVIESLGKLRAESVQTCVTSPPYWGLRDYGTPGQLGLEATPDEYVRNMVNVFREVRRVLREDGTLWLNLGDSYAASTKGSGGTGKGTIAGGQGQATNAGSFYAAKFDLDASGLKPKDLVGIPWRVAFALQADGWYLRSDIIWHKPNPMPESVTDRPTKAHEYLFLMAKSAKYHYDVDAIREAPTKERHVPTWEERKAAGAGSGSLTTGANANHGKGLSHDLGNAKGRNKRSVWTVTPKPYRGAHFATFPPDLIEPCILAGAPEGGTVLDPFAGSGTTLMVARQHDRRAIGIELNPDYIPLILDRCGISARPAVTQDAITEVA